MPREIDFNENLGPLNEIEDHYKKEKLKHLILHGQDAEPGETYFSKYPPNNSIEGQLWFRTSDCAVLICCLHPDTNKKYWAKTYDK